MYGHLKVECADVIVEGLRPIQEKYNELMSDKKQLEDILADGAGEAFRRARKTMSKVYKKIGLIPPKRR